MKQPSIPFLLFLLFPISIFTADHDINFLDQALEYEAEQRQERFTKFDDLILSRAPRNIRNLPDRLNNPERLIRMPYPCMTLIGKPGVYKTSLIQAVANKAGWDIREISPRTLSFGSRNASSEHLRKEMEAITESPYKVIVILDELNALVTNYKSEHHDSDMLSRALWNTIDEVKRTKRTDIFFMATMNSFQEIPSPLKTRLFGMRVDIPEINDSAFRLYMHHQMLSQ